jgi:hypothetical protein
VDDRLTVLSPAPSKEVGADRSGPVIDDLEGKVVALRMDWLWPAYNAVVDVWAERFAERGAKVHIYNTRDEQENLSLERREERSALVFAHADLAVVGLGN